MKPGGTTCVSFRTGTDSTREEALATALQLPLLATTDARVHDYRFSLRYEPAGLTLYQHGPNAPGGLCVDFGSPQLQRRASDSLKQQNLCKAAGLARPQAWHILDAMAGLGRDAWLLSLRGARVDMLERAPVVAALLQDALQRGREHASAASPLHRLHLQQADFLQVADTLPVYDVVYLDPMFPPTGKNARAKKEMQLLQSLLHADLVADEALLLETARGHARRRVVVKRGRRSPPLASCTPDIQFQGSSNRFDVYLNTQAGK